MSRIFPLAAVVLTSEGGLSKINSTALLHSTKRSKAHVIYVALSPLAHCADQVLGYIIDVYISRKVIVTTSEDDSKVTEYRIA